MSELTKKAALMAIIAQAFFTNAGIKVLLVTDDGNCFKPQDKGMADWHARTTEQVITEYQREDFEQEVAQLEAAKAEAVAKELEVRAEAQRKADEKAAAEKAAADAKKALLERALAVGLPAQATEEEIVAAETEAGITTPPTKKKK